MLGTILEESIIAIDSILSIKEPKNIGKIPSQVVTNSSARGGMSATRVFAKISDTKKNLGLPTGTLEDGSINADDILWYTFAQAIIDEISIHAKITTSTLPGQLITAAGGNAGGPINVVGQTITWSNGGTTIE